MSEPWSSKQRSKKGRGRPLFGVNAVVCSKKKKVTKNARKKTKKDLTGPTLLEISEYANQSWQGGGFKPQASRGFYKVVASWHQLAPSLHLCSCKVGPQSGRPLLVS
jgi:hypothetical protein